MADLGHLLLNAREVRRHARALSRLEAEVGLSNVAWLLATRYSGVSSRRGGVLLAITRDELLIAVADGELVQLFEEPLADVVGCRAVGSQGLAITLDDRSEMNFAGGRSAQHVSQFCEVLTAALRSPEELERSVAALLQRPFPANATPPLVPPERRMPRERLLELHGLFGDGLVTQEEYERRRAEIIADI